MPEGHWEEINLDWNHPFEMKKSTFKIFCLKSGCTV